MSDTIQLIGQTIQRLETQMQSISNELSYLKNLYATLIANKDQCDDEKKEEPVHDILSTYLANTKLKPSSQKTYKKIWQRLNKKVFNKDIVDVQDFINNPQIVCDYVLQHEKQPINKLRTIYTPLKQNNIKCDYYGEQIQKLDHTKYAHPEKKKERTEVPKKIIPDDGKIKWTWDQIVSYYDALCEKSDKNHDEWTSLVMLAIAVELAPQRANEIKNLQWTDDTKNNCIALDKKMMIIRLNKSNKYPVEFALNDKLVGILTNYQDYQNTLIEDAKNVFYNSKGRPYANAGGGFQKCLKRCTNLTLHQLRHIYISDRLESLSPNERNEKARLMFHQVPAQILAYNVLEQVK